MPKDIGNLKGKTVTPVLTGTEDSNNSAVWNIFDQIRYRIKNIWPFAPGAVDATGGTKIVGANFTYHVFTGPGPMTFTNIPPAVPVDMVAVAGGGNGGTSMGGGGGAGGLVYGAYTIPGSPFNFTINVGAGAPTSGGSPAGIPGSPTSVAQPTIFGTVTVNGGGGAGAYQFHIPPGAGAPGGSGGGGGGSYGSATTGGTGNAPSDSIPAAWSTRVTRYGTPGGTGPSSVYVSASGGGAQNPGQAGASSSNGAPGGAGKSTVFPGPVIAPTIPAPVQPRWTPTVGPNGYYGGGGGSAGYNGSTTPGIGGVGGGGDGTTNSNLFDTTNTNGVDFTGGGGGGGGYGVPTAHDGIGGDGVVIFRYPNSV